VGVEVTNGMTVMPGVNVAAMPGAKVDVAVAGGAPARRVAVRVKSAEFCAVVGVSEGCALVGVIVGDATTGVSVESIVGVEGTT